MMRDCNDDENRGQRRLLLQPVVRNLVVVAAVFGHLMSCRAEQFFLRPDHRVLTAALLIAVVNKQDLEPFHCVSQEETFAPIDSACSMESHEAVADYWKTRHCHLRFGKQPS
jgi:hypothetical protein